MYIYIYIMLIQNYSITYITVTTPLTSFRPNSNACLPYFPAHKTHFCPRKMGPKFDLHLMRRGYYFQTYKYPYPHRVKTTMKMILVAVTTIFWVSMMNKLYYGC